MYYEFDDKYMGVYRYYSFSNGKRDHPFSIYKPLLNADICTHCGGVIRPKINYVDWSDGFDDYCEQARMYSLK